MTELLAALGQKVAQRWLESVLAPGLAYVALAGWALLAGHDNPFGLTHLGNRLNQWWTIHTAHAGTTIAVVAALLAAASIAGSALGAAATHVVQPLWTTSVPRRRMGRDTTEPGTARRAAAIGETFRHTGSRVAKQYELSLSDAWPRIWLLASTDVRAVVSAAARRYESDAILSAWGLLMLPWSIRCWAIAPVAAAAMTYGYMRARSDSAVLATVIEATVDTHALRLAEALGVAVPSGTVTRIEGPVMTNILQKGTPTPRSRRTTVHHGD